ncbi:DNA polymerase III subunit delta' [Capsulimonas corticalis]|uniref:DNA polymerase III subunit delta n=1 Tax=Capsulimonas corticalis TaxID=2219043 RepID=A0A402D4R7_9BACT|nr:DNA polymerase III subunit delta' [Capsulimonas corticalis]BDI31974.1 DNA polymerase III subunit delta' [Capsulimonas corticalis]
MLEEIVGQANAVATLEHAFPQGRLTGSYLFVGPDGVGKTTTAQLFAAQLCGATAPDDSVTRRVFAGTHPDVRMVEPAGKSNTIHVAQLWPRSESKDYPSERAMLRDLHFEPMAGPKRIFIIKEAEGLRGGNEASANSILKSLEEPPAYAHFILTAASTAGLLPTIVSRCQVIHFGLLPAGEIETILIARHGADPDQARFLAAYCEGRIGRAISLLRSPDLLAGRDELLDLADRALRAPQIASFKLAEEFRKLAPKLKADSGDAAADEKERGAREPVLNALSMLAVYFRDLTALRVMGPSKAVIINADRAEHLKKGAPLYSEEALVKALSLIFAIRQGIERNANAQLATELLFAELAALRTAR